MKHDKSILIFITTTKKERGNLTTTVNGVCTGKWCELARVKLSGLYCNVPFSVGYWPSHGGGGGS